MKYLTLALLCMLTTAHAAPILPDPNLTPGEARTTDDMIACLAHTGGEEDSVRSVPKKLSNQVYKSYGLDGNHKGYCGEAEKGCEIDHLIPLKLGGANTAANLWPQSYGGEQGAFLKDALEKTLIARVCRTNTLHPKKLPLAEAQKAISTNWLDAYQKYVINRE